MEKSADARVPGRDCPGSDIQDAPLLLYPASSHYLLFNIIYIMRSYRDDPREHTDNPPSADALFIGIVARLSDVGEYLGTAIALQQQHLIRGKSLAHLHTGAAHRHARHGQTQGILWRIG